MTSNEAAPRSLSVRVFGLNRFKPANGKEVWLDAAPQPESIIPKPRPKSGNLFQGLQSFKMLRTMVFGCAFFVFGLAGFLFFGGYAVVGFIKHPKDFAGAGFAMSLVLALVLLGVVLARRRLRVFELDELGIRLRNSSGSISRLIPFAAVRSVQTYFDEQDEGGQRRGVVLGLDPENVTLELGMSTGVVAAAICQHTGLKARHSRASVAARRR